MKLKFPFFLKIYYRQINYYASMQYYFTQEWHANEVARLIHAPGRTLCGLFMNFAFIATKRSAERDVTRKIHFRCAASRAVTWGCARRVTRGTQREEMDAQLRQE